MGRCWQLGQRYRARERERERDYCPFAFLSPPLHIPIETSNWKSTSENVSLCLSITDFTKLPTLFWYKVLSLSHLYLPSFSFIFVCAANHIPKVEKWRLLQFAPCTRWCLELCWKPGNCQRLDFKPDFILSIEPLLPYNWFANGKSSGAWRWRFL